MTKIQFASKLESGKGGGHFVAVPDDVIEALGGGGRIPVRATFNGVPYVGSIVRMGGVCCVGVLKSIIEQAGLAVGRRVAIEIERDTSERTVEPTTDLQAALVANAAAGEAWSRLSYTNKREHVRAIESAKKPETRARRVAATVEALTNQGAKSV